MSPAHALSEDEHSTNTFGHSGTLNDQASEIGCLRTAQSFMGVLKLGKRVVGLSLNRYKEIEYEENEYAAPAEIIRGLQSCNSNQRWT